MEEKKMEEKGKKKRARDPSDTLGREKKDLPTMMQILEATSFKTKVQLGDVNTISTTAGLIDSGACPNAKFFAPGQVCVQRAYRDREEHNDMTDETGHGTICASVLCGTRPKKMRFGPLEFDGSADGLPPPKVAIYKVSKPEDSVKAFMAAVDDGVSVLSISSAYKPTAQQADKSPVNRLPFSDVNSKNTFMAMANGILPCMAVGNTRGDPMENTMPWAASCSGVGSKFKVTTKLHLLMAESSHQTITGHSVNTYADVKKCRLITVEDATIARTNKLDPEKVKNKIVVLRSSSKRGVDESAKEAGAAGIIVVTGSKSPFKSFIHRHPAISVNARDGQRIYGYIEEHKENAWVRLDQSQVIYEGVDFPILAEGTSRESCPWSSPFIFKPDIYASSELVPCATRQEANDQDEQRYTLGEGTSLAAPAVAHAIAFLRHHHPNWTAAESKSALITTSRPITKFKRPRDKLTAGGPGVMDPMRALDPGVVHDIHPEEYAKCVRGQDYCCPDMLDYVNSFTTSRDTMHWCDLNLPTFRAPIPDHMMMWDFNRTMKYVGRGDEVFEPDYETDEGLVLEVDAKSKEVYFNRPGQLHTYDLKATVTDWGDNDFLTGALFWKSSSNRYTVRCPILVVRQKATPPTDNIPQKGLKHHSLPPHGEAGSSKGYPPAKKYKNAFELFSHQDA